MSEPLFCYCLKIADREFLIEVAQDGIIYWDARIHKVSATREEWWWEEEESLDGGENLAGGWQ